MSNRLESIQVSGFKSIRELDIKLRDLNVLIGANGSGKSNFISLFRLLNEILESRLQTYSGAIGADSLLYYGRKTTSEIDITLTFVDDNYANGYEISLIPSEQGTLIFAYEGYSFHDRSRYANGLDYRVGEGHRETLLFDVSEQYRRRVVVDYVIDTLSNWKIYHFHDTSPDSAIKQAGNIHENDRLKPDASNLAAYLYLLQEKYPSYYRKIMRTVKRVTPFFDDFVLRPNPLNEDTIRLQWRDVNSADNVFNAHTLSDGTLRFMCLATLLLQPDEKLPSLILIDEPELGLHPFAINILVSLLRSVATKTQVILSTQSVPLINQFDLEDIIVVDRKDKQSTFARLDTETFDDWMTEYSGYGIGDLWEKNVIGGRPQREAS
ncbi:MAG: AAA family ATPase [Chloroflexota bacterium]